MNFLNRFKLKKESAEESCKLPTPAPAENTEETSEADDSDTIVVFEHERFRVDLGWSYRNLEVGDPKRYTSKLHQSATDLEPKLPLGWEYVGADWRVDTKVKNSDAGWLYGFDFRTLELKDDCAGSQPFVRRRRWIRMVGCSIEEAAGDVVSRAESGSLMEENMSETTSQFGTPTPSVLAGIDFEEEEEEGEEEDDLDLEAMIEFDPTLKSTARVIKDPQLTAIGRRMRAIEEQCRKEDDAKMKEWNKRVAPTYKANIKELDGRIKALRKRINSEVSVGDAHIAALEEELLAHQEAQDATKRNLYFPNSALSLGSAGVYFALDDFWLELASGQFILDLVPSKESPQVILLLTGTADGNDSGVSVRLKIGGFKLRGDSGKGVPPISLESVKVTVTIRVTVMLTFSVSQQKWTSSAQNFKVEMIKFKGPFGLSRNVVAGVLSIVTPILRGQLLAALPPELGMFLASLASPLSVRGEFNIGGTALKNFSQPLFKCVDMCNLVGYSSEQLLRFVAMQKSIDRKPLKTMDDLLKYRRLGTTHHKHWDEIRLLWSQAGILYHEKLCTLTDVDMNNSTPLSFERILQGTDEILRNPLRVKFTLHNCDGQISLRSLLDNTQLFFERWRASKEKEKQDIGQFVMLMQKFSQMLDMSREVLTLLSRSLDFIDLRVAVSMLAGSSGELCITVNDIIAQAPLSLWAAMPKELSFGFEAPVPFVITVCPLDDGSIDITIFHCGSKQIQYRSKFYQWREKQCAAPESPRASGKKASFSSENGTDPGLEGTESVKTDNDTSPHVASSAEDAEAIPVSRIVSDISIQSDVLTESSVDIENGMQTQTVEKDNEATVEALGTSSSLFSRGSSVSKLAPPTASSTPLGRRRSLMSFSSGEYGNNSSFSFRSQRKGDEISESAHSIVNPSSSSIKPASKEGPISNTEKQRRALEKTLSLRPKPMEAQKILEVKVLRPHVSVIVDKPVTLKPGSELFTFRVGPLESDWKPFGYGEDQTCAHTRTRHESAPPLEDTDEDAADVQEERKRKSEREVIQLPGCPMLVQTTNHVKFLAQVPNVQITFRLATLLRFLSIYFDDIEILRSYLGITSERAKEATEEYIYLFKVLVDRLGKYLLLPNLSLCVNMAIKVVATDEDIHISFETNIQDRSTDRSSENSASSPCAIKLGARINVMDVISDAIAIKNSLLRCAEVYERHIAEDEAAERAKNAEDEAGGISTSTIHPSFVEAGDGDREHQPL